MDYMDMMVSKAFDEANEATFYAFHDALYRCEEIDPYCEWEDCTVGDMLEALREEGKDKQADNLEAELAKVYEA